MKESASIPKLLQPLANYSKAYYAFVGFLLGVIGLGAYAYSTQLQNGLVVTGMRNNVLWGLYITNFVFFIGISHVGALMSAILRLSGAEWRKPITRMAEAITACSLAVGALMPIVDLGRPDRILNILLYGRIQSPILWDFISIGTYLAGSLVFLLLPLIPDIAMLRDRLSGVSSLRQRIYRTLSFGWRDTPYQQDRLEKAIGVMTILIIPIAISVHTVVSWIFAMTLRVGWNSSIFGPYFVAGALLSGVASVILAMAFFRHFYHLEDYLTPRHFRNLANLMLAMIIVYIYFVLNEFLTPAYKWETAEGQLLGALFTGEFSALFMAAQVGGLVVPAILLSLRRTRNILGYSIASMLVVVGIWIKRFVIIVPTLARSQIAEFWATYQPSWVEWSITAAAFAGFILLYTVFSRVFPIISIWESAGTGETSGEHVALTTPSGFGLAAGQPSSVQIGSVIGEEL